MKPMSMYKVAITKSGDSAEVVYKVGDGDIVFIGQKSAFDRYKLDWISLTREQMIELRDLLIELLEEDNNV